MSGCAGVNIVYIVEKRCRAMEMRNVVGEQCLSRDYNYCVRQCTSQRHDRLEVWNPLARQHVIARLALRRSARTAELAMKPLGAGANLSRPASPLPLNLHRPEPQCLAFNGVLAK